MSTSQPKTPTVNPVYDSVYDYSNHGRPRDFDIRIEVAEQQEIVKQSQERFADSRWHCSEYDF